MSVSTCSLGCNHTCPPQPRKPLHFRRSTIAANLGRVPGSLQTALCNTRAGSNAAAAGTAEVGNPEESSEIFKTNDGVVEAVDDDEAEVVCVATQF